MRIAVTGASGFLGWHVRAVAYAMGVHCVPITRAELGSPEHLGRALDGVDAILHCAGVNRGADVTVGNIGLASRVVEVVRHLRRPPRLVYANSVQASGDSEYGAAKRRASEILAGAAAAYSDVLLPNLFGEHGRPNYNSFVATFCADVAAGRMPQNVADRQIDLLSVQDAAQLLLTEAGTGTGLRTVQPPGTPVSVSLVLRLLREFDAVYRSGDLPELSDRFKTRLFNTYRSFLFPRRYPIVKPAHTDLRGTLVECVRAGSGGQAFVSTTKPGVTRGNHFHLRKFERFMVVDGSAEIALRRMFTNEIVRFRVDGQSPGFVDIPTMWTHNITAVGDRPAVTFFWSNEQFDPADPDTFACSVEGAEDSHPDSRTVEGTP